MFGVSEQTSGTIVATLITSLVALLGLIISKEQKVSDFRQAWIDHLREDIAAVITYTHAIHDANNANFASQSALWTQTSSDFARLNEASSRVKLRLNPKEGASKAILGVLDEHEGHFRSAFPNLDTKKLDEFDKQLLEKSQILLKQEWKRVKSGEFTYRAAKSLASVVVLISILMFLVHVLLLVV